jgi:methylated-DNA-protein-cysteine methyltransferase-like protein
LIGAPANSRQVGSALKHLPHPPRDQNDESERDYDYYSDSVPWWRVINASGRVSNVNTRQHQVVKLQQEIPETTTDGKVDLDKYGWFPDEIDF